MPVKKLWYSNSQKEIRKYLDANYPINNILEQILTNEYLIEIYVVAKTNILFKVSKKTKIIIVYTYETFF